MGASFFKKKVCCGVIKLNSLIYIVWDGRVETDSGKSYLPLLMPNNNNPSGSPLTHKKYTLAFKTECVRQMAAGARQTDVARAHSLLSALLGRWQR